MRASTTASQASGSTSLSFAVVIRVAIAAARSAPRSEPAKSHDFLPRANPRSARSAALFDRQMRPSSRKRKGVPALEHVVDRLGDGRGAGQLSAFVPKPLLQVCNERRASLGSRASALLGAEPVDAALDLEQRVNALDGFQCDG